MRDFSLIILMRKVVPERKKLSWFRACPGRCSRKSRGRKRFELRAAPGKDLPLPGGSDDALLALQVVVERC